MTTTLVPTSKPFGVWSGVGLVVANMVGAGVFLSTGFMAQSMTPGAILLAWLVGGVLALSGARAYAEVARLVPKGGGEYRYLTELLHPAFGYLAGWGSLVLGFSAPVAVDALAAGAFARALWPAVEPRWVAAGLVVGLTAAHAVGLRSSTRLQNGLVVLKVLLVVGFVGVTAAAGTLAPPAWVPASPTATPATTFIESLFYIAFAYSGWNAAVYASDEFGDPARDVPRAMLIGCAGVTALYLVVNYLFVANLTPQQSAVVFSYKSFASLDAQFEQVTLGQAVLGSLLGPAAAKVMSAVMLLLFVSAMSAMTVVGPRVYAAMARDGFLPRGLAGSVDGPPVGALLLQGAIALVVLFTHELRTTLTNVGAVLVFFAALTAAGLFRATLRARTVTAAPFESPGSPASATAPATAPPAPSSLVAAGVYIASSAVMLYIGFRRSPSMLLWIGGLAAVALVAWAATRSLRGAGGSSPGGVS